MILLFYILFSQTLISQYNTIDDYKLNLWLMWQCAKVLPVSRTLIFGCSFRIGDHFVIYVQYIYTKVVPLFLFLYLQGAMFCFAFFHLLYFSSPFSVFLYSHFIHFSQGDPPLKSPADLFTLWFNVIRFIMLQIYIQNSHCKLTQYVIAVNGGQGKYPSIFKDNFEMSILHL